MFWSARHRALAASAGLLSLTLTACGPSQTSSTLDERAEWSQSALPATAEMSGPRIDIRAVLGAHGDLPPLLAVSGADPGEPDRARVWTNLGDEWRWKDLPLPMDAYGQAAVATTDGAMTWVAGTTWRAGESIVPFLVESSDRSAWKAVALPDEAIDAAVAPGAAVPLSNGVLIVGRNRDDRPVAVRVGEESGLAVLPEAPDSREFRGFNGVTVLGDTVLAVGRAAAPGQSDESVVYRSTDGGNTWSVAMAPASGPSVPHGVAMQGERFVITGSVWGADSLTTAAAWSSADGDEWTAEQLPALDTTQVGFPPGGGVSAWLAAPIAGGDRLVTPVQAENALNFAVLQRDVTGTWTVLGSASYWKVPGAAAVAGLSEDGSVVIAQSARNVGRVGVMSARGHWSNDPVKLGTNDAGRSLGAIQRDGSPVLIGSHATVTPTARGGWRQEVTTAAYTVSGGVVADRPWDPAESERLSTVGLASDPHGASVLLGADIATDGDGDEKLNLTGWFRPAGGEWTPVTGFDTPRSEYLTDLTYTGDSWVAVGASRESFEFRSLNEAAVWTSTDGVTWAHEVGPFTSTVPGGQYTARGACALPGGDLLVVGQATEQAQERPLAWRRTGGQWQQIDTAALGSTFGSLSSCTTTDDTTLLQGSRDGRETVWRTRDGVTFEATQLGERGDSFGPIRVIDGGFAAAGTRGSDGQRGAVVWLSEDGRDWRAVPVPANRPLTGVDVTTDGDTLLLAANSGSAPEIWVLGNPAELLAAD
ncbi:hypothetical protein [Modestobacter sp. SYSU DS0657]